MNKLEYEILKVLHDDCGIEYVSPIRGDIYAIPKYATPMASKGYIIPGNLLPSLEKASLTEKLIKEWEENNEQ